MNDAIAERIAIALEQIALELVTRDVRAPHPVTQEPYRAVQHVTQPGPVTPYLPLGWQCPVHHDVKEVPAGISGRTGKPYSAFLACPEMGCPEKPPRYPAPAPARAVAPSDAGLAPRILP